MQWESSLDRGAMPLRCLPWRGRPRIKSGAGSLPGEPDADARRCARAAGRRLGLGMRSEDVGRAVDLTDMRFARLLVVAEVPRRGWHRYWVSRCVCGCERVLAAGSLR